MNECPLLLGCPIFEKFVSEGLANVWIKNYCKGNPDNCERRKLKLEGKDVPISLLPNGDTMQSFND